MVKDECIAFVDRIGFPKSGRRAIDFEAHVRENMSADTKLSDIALVVAAMAERWLEYWRQRSWKQRLYSALSPNAKTLRIFGSAFGASSTTNYLSRGFIDTDGEIVAEAYVNSTTEPRICFVGISFDNFCLVLSAGVKKTDMEYDEIGELTGLLDTWFEDDLRRNKGTFPASGFKEGPVTWHFLQNGQLNRPVPTNRAAVIPDWEDKIPAQVFELIKRAKAAGWQMDTVPYADHPADWVIDKVRLIGQQMHRRGWRGRDVSGNPGVRHYKAGYKVGSMEWLKDLTDSYVDMTATYQSETDKDDDF